MKDVQLGCVRLATIAVLGLLANAVPERPAAAETVRYACTHDAFRLCSNAIPDVGRTKACLARHRNSLSPRCQTAFGGGSTHERSPQRSAQERSAQRSAQEPSPQRSAQEPSPQRSAEQPSPERTATERHHSTHARRYGYVRHYHRYRRFHLFPFF